MQDDGTTTTTLKYYSIAGMRVAMDDGTDLVYFASDNLSSTSIVMSDTGTLLSEQRYLPFGKVRADVGTLITETDFGYTGQRDLGGMGLMDYNARFYSPRLGRFIQPDTIVPNAGNPQSWNRFSYVGNNPVNRIDPSGHYTCATETCDLEGSPEYEDFINGRQPGNKADQIIDDLKMETSDLSEEQITVGLAEYGVTATGFSRDELAAIYIAVMLVAAKYGSAMGLDPATAFMLVHQLGVGNNFTFAKCHDCTTGLAETKGSNRIIVESLFSAGDSFTKNIKIMIHELGHAFNRSVCEMNNGGTCSDPAGPGSTYEDVPDNLVTDYGEAQTGYNGYAGGSGDWQFRGIGNHTEGENFADMFLGWTLNTWASSANGNLGNQRRFHMSNVMSSKGYFGLFSP